MDESTTGVWSSLLRDSSKRSSLTVDKASCIIVGENDVGKSTLLGKLTSNSTSEVNETIKKQGNRVVKDVLSYGYLDVEDGVLDTSYLCRVNFWTMSNEAFAGCIDTVLHGNRTVFVIAVDVSQPDSCLASAKKWLSIVRQLASQRPGMNTEDLQWNDMGKQIPIILVACKCEVVQIDDAVSLKRAKELQGQLRELGLQVNATVVYVSSATDINIARLKRYILHRLYPEVDTMATEGSSSSSIEDGITTAFVPAGTDNATLISIATGYQMQNSNEYLASLDEVASKYIPTAGIMRGVQGIGEEKTAASERMAGLVTLPVVATGTAITTGATVPAVELEDEEEWLTGLQSYIAQVTASSSVGTTSSSSSSSSSKSALPMSGASQSQPSSSSLSSNVNSSMANGNIGGSTTGTGIGTEKDKKLDRKHDKKGSDVLPPLPPPAGSAPAAASVAPAVEGRSTRRSTRTLAGQQATGSSSSSQPKEEVGDFFKNLLLMGTTPGPPPASQSSTAVDDGNKK